MRKPTDIEKARLKAACRTFNQEASEAVNASRVNAGAGMAALVQAEVKLYEAIGDLDRDPNLDLSELIEWMLEETELGGVA